MSIIGSFGGLQISLNCFKLKHMCLWPLNWYGVFLHILHRHIWVIIFIGNNVLHCFLERWHHSGLHGCFNAKTGNNNNSGGARSIWLRCWTGRPYTQLQLIEVMESLSTCTSSQTHHKGSELDISTKLQIKGQYKLCAQP